MVITTVLVIVIMIKIKMKCRVNVMMLDVTYDNNSNGIIICSSSAK